MQMKSNMNRRRKEICAGMMSYTPGVQVMAVPEKSPQGGIIMPEHWASSGYPCLCALCAATPDWSGSCQTSQPELSVIRFLHHPCHPVSADKQTHI